jgi:bifunctional DNA-binding transcriptional regulator/antitoxin component of YhaV-PrlF toxin-antitoxin module
MQDFSITSRWQTTIPREIRDALALRHGDKLRYRLLADGEVRIFRTGSVMDLAGVLYDPDRKPLTVEDMDAGIAEAVKNRLDRS